jgi:predicted dehydrogenase
MSVEFTNGALGMIHASRFGTGYLNTLRLRIFGDKGALEVQHGLDGSTLRACIGDDIESPIWQEIAVDPVPTNYQRFVEAVRAGRSLDPTFRHAAYLQKILDLAMRTNDERKELAAG